MDSVMLLRAALRRCTETAMVAAALAVAGCGGGGDSGSGTGGSQNYVLGGTISGLTASGLVLADNTVTLPMSAGATSFSFGSILATGAAYSVTVQTAPTGLTCSVANGTGTASTADIANIVVTCSANAYTLGGTITGLTIAGLVLANGSDTVAVAAIATTFTLPKSVAFTGGYAVTVATQPAGLNCLVSNGSGTMPAANVTNVMVICSAIADTSAPTVPTGLAATPVNSSTLSLSWNASTDVGTGIGGYHLFRAGVPIATVAAPTTTYTDTNRATATTYSYAVTAFDLATPANESAQSSSAAATTPAVDPTPPITDQGSPAAQTFPSLGNYSIGGEHDYDNAAVIAHAALDDVYVVSTWNGWQSGRSLTMPQVETAIAAQSRRGTKIISYFDPIYTRNGSAAYIAQMNSANFWLRSGWPGGAISQFAGADSADVYPGGPTDAWGRTYVQYDADYNVDWMFNGSAAGLATDSTDAVNSGLSGVYEDDLLTARTLSGDWARTGDPESGDDAQMRAAFLSILQRMQADKPGLLAFANLSGAQKPSSVFTEYVGQFDGGVLENMVGSVDSIEQFGADASTGVLAYQNQMTLLNSNKYGIFSAYNITANGEDQINPITPYQAMRHAFAFCLVVGNARCSFEDQRNDPDGAAALWFDEESVNLTTRNPYPRPDASAAPGLGYLGTAVDSPQTAPYQNGYWRRRFQNGEVWWSPREATGGTINFGRTVYFINGVQAPDFNTGGSGSTHAISSRDGIVVLY